ncbi:glycosyltransferase family 4 protein [Phycisphaera mikurensis]|uniref:Putative glycosyltransferase n=1 Tax=Phycisphaera mikurensis (strain NBRC 102666 / KCTC 22515 / FYK2301M01) TaxID=1142394 RepID=I0IHX5_PHYMF|nr:glycosyltransferase family 4 protein [Phycisphaera mikurensis]MBB6441103.1 glycosyltransferase involved in cell wall biosynthesis [Phycisphaera mikurensis]BAM04863.1 putative glycosyltransferase [Phycisphaera mikurensis NBRC 102666]
MSGVAQQDPLRVLVVAENASKRAGGEAFLPVQWFRRYLERGVDARLLAHDRYADELRELFPEHADRLHFVADAGIGGAFAHRYRTSRLSPPLRRLLYRPPSRVLFLRRLRRAARALVAEHRVQVVHECNPVSPREPGGLWGLGAPLVVGPLNGAIEPMPGFDAVQARVQGPLKRAAMRVAPLLHRVLPGKRRATLVLAANERTRRALPAVRGEVEVFCENGVDLKLWQPEAIREPDAERPIRFAFLGRLVRWKSVDVLFRAMELLAERGIEAELDVYGRGTDEDRLAAAAASSPAADRLHLHGFVRQEDAAETMRGADAFCLPSVQECGGAVVLEAMALGLPVVVTDWGGPAEYVTGAEGFKVGGGSSEELARGFADAMGALATDAGLRRRAGEAGLRRAAEEAFDWDRRADWMIARLRRVVAAGGS